MIQICALASGSNGNCYYIGTQDEAVLVDVGIHYKRFRERLQDASLAPEKIKAAIISHEHNDHVQGARSLSKQLNIPVFYTRKTYHKCYKRNRADIFRLFTPGISFSVGNLEIYPFLKPHDAVEPCSFTIKTQKKTIGVFTDIGWGFPELVKLTDECDALFLETNYDENKLKTGIYPPHLKERVLSDRGHLSNEQAADLIRKSDNNRKIIICSHISAYNNTEELIRNTFSDLQSKHTLCLSSRERISDIFTL